MNRDKKRKLNFWHVSYPVQSWTVSFNTVLSYTLRFFNMATLNSFVTDHTRNTFYSYEEP